ncbi:alkylated DNA repair protein [Rhizobium sp. Leaf384]|nr:alkylated DNA repair protein [Rhizobium sp. Leaf384]KQS83990.1 alkylated DNA repair protein [Rhizobium sp. Leaf383]
MRKWVLILLSLLAGGLIAGPIIWIVTMPHRVFNTGDPRLQPAGDVSRGARVFAAADCASCHARPGGGDRLQLGGGLALASPFGTFRPPNISPDGTDGIGTWTVTDLGNALVSGVSPDGRHYYPAFPYTSYTGMTSRDIRDLYAYLMSLPVVSGKAPAHDLPLLFKIRRMIGGWKLLFFREGQPAGEEKAAGEGEGGLKTSDPQLARGAYLVSSLGHCAECHSTRNILGAIRQETLFAGGIDPEGTGFVPNITPERIGPWSQQDIVRMLSTGETPDHGRVGSSMADVVENTRQLPESDRQAIAAYIKALAPRPTPAP